MTSFGLTATSMFEIWTPPSSPPALVDRMVLFLYFLFRPVFFFFFFFPYQGLSSDFNFFMSKDFSIGKELPRKKFDKCVT